jgi:YgiT-type zinc finger domain-containing protein
MLDRIRDQARDNNAGVTQHAQQEMVEAHISLDDVLETISQGTILEACTQHRRSTLFGMRSYSGRTSHPCRLHHGTANTCHHYGLRTWAAQVDHADAKETIAMKCTIDGCPGEYGAGNVMHTVRQHGQVMVIDHVPADVCSVCGEVLPRPNTVRRIEALLQDKHQPVRTVPLYEFA